MCIFCLFVCCSVRSSAVGSSYCIVYRMTGWQWATNGKKWLCLTARYNPGTCLEELKKFMKNLIIQCEHGITQIHVRCVTAGANLLSKPDLQDLWENHKCGFRGSVHHVDCSKWNQHDVVQQVFYCTLVGSTCFGCRRHPSSGAQYVQSRSVGTMCVW